MQDVALTFASAVDAHIKRVWRGLRNQARVIAEAPPNPSAPAAISSKRRYGAARESHLSGCRCPSMTPTTLMVRG